MQLINKKVQNHFHNKVHNTKKIIVIIKAIQKIKVWILKKVQHQISKITRMINFNFFKERNKLKMK